MTPEAISDSARTRSTLHARKPRHFAAAPDEQQPPPGRSIFEYVPERDGQDQRVPEQQRDAEQLGREHRRDQRRQRLAEHDRGIRHPQHDAIDEIADAERDDQRMDAEIEDEERIDGADERRRPRARQARRPGSARRPSR